MTFWHYTCHHGFAALGSAGSVLPAQDLTPGPLPWPSRFGWFTDLGTPQPDALGLQVMSRPSSLSVTRHLVTCDRTAHRYRVTDDTGVVSWLSVARVMPRELRDQLEAVLGARPRHWYVATTPVPVELDERTATA